jgi:phosphopantothenoylcysteine decarboxylase/phosphopantothenate--cysteine ligase
MGYALARAALDRGARVKLVSGPVSIEPPSGAEVINVKSAAEMYEAVMGSIQTATIVIMAAAVADYRPARRADQKLKKNSDRLVLELEPTEDILRAVGQQKGGRVLVGFAAETESVVENGRKKLSEKGADLIVANDVSIEGSGFDVETNRVILISELETIELPLLSKLEAADKILDKAAGLKHALLDHVSG